jgi:hypothetical protein
MQNPEYHYTVPASFHVAESNMLYWVVVIVSVAALAWAIRQSHKEAEVSMEITTTPASTGAGTPSVAVK